MQIEAIKEKLFILRKKDIGFKTFGAITHRYNLLPAKSESDLDKFENTFRIKLPKGYRDFLTKIGNGKAGPYYGLEPLESSLYIDLDNKKDDNLVNPSSEFLLTEKWNLSFDNIEDQEYWNKKDEEYFDPKWDNGILRLSNFGCGVWINLVVNGNEYGNVWIDDRCNDGGIYPAIDKKTGNRMDFLTWYNQWLDNSIAEI